MRLQLPHDIIEPAPISWWPPAPGWWLLAVLVLLALVLAIRWYRRSKRQLAPLRQALQEHQQLLLHWQQHRQQLRDSRAVCAALSALLKRVARHYYPEHDVASLTGENWRAFLQRTGDNAFTDEQAGALIQQAFAAPNTVTGEPPLAATRDWLLAQRKRALALDISTIKAHQTGEAHHV